MSDKNDQLSSFFLSNCSLTTDSNRSKRSTSYNSGDGIVSTKSSTPRSSSAISSPAPVSASPLNSSLTNIISNYSPPAYAVHDRMLKSAPNKAPTNTKNGASIEAAANGTSYSSLLCYQSVPPPSPPSSLSTPKHAQKVITSALMIEKLGPDPDIATVKKRSKLRHRFSDVGSWGRKKKERNPKYHSIHIETLEVLGEPVVEDEFFVSKF